MTATAPVSTSVLDVLERFDDDFATVIKAIENGEYALWVGSGISAKAPSLGKLVGLAIEFLREKAIDPKTEATYRPALEEALQAGGAKYAEALPYINNSFADWPEALQKSIINTLWNNYSALLNIRIEGEDDDLILWKAIDVREAFAKPNPPSTEHLCIAILGLEGAVSQIASANWDGFIEAAFERLGSGLAGNLQVIVDPDHLRDGAAKAQLFKFHGCVVHAIEDPAHYRSFLTGSTQQIMDWTVEPKFKPMVERITAIATDRKALMVGLSLQDVNLQQVFTKARQANPWPWPATPSAQGHVFCEENGLGTRQIDMLKSVYKGNYNPNIAAIKQSALLQAWPSAVLPAIVLRIITDKLRALLTERLTGTLLKDDAHSLADHLVTMCKCIARSAPDDDRTSYVTNAIGIWSRLVSLHRDGALPARPGTYQSISSSPVATVANDGNVVAAGFGDLAIALSLLQHGAEDERWSLSPPTATSIADGAILATGSYDNAKIRPLYVVRSASQAVKLQRDGALNKNSIVIHSDSVWTALFDGGLDEDNPDTTTTSRGKLSSAPGRNGTSQAHHVSLETMLEKSPDIATLKDAFIRGVMI